MFLANATTQNHQTLDEKKVQLLLAEKMLTEHHEMLNSLLESQVTLKLHGIQTIFAEHNETSTYSNRLFEN